MDVVSSAGIVEPEQNGPTELNVVVIVALTVIVVVLLELQGAVPSDYVIVCVPTPAVAGLNNPVEETPGPVQVPPIFTAVN